MKKLIVANWKMNPASSKEAQRFFSSLARGLRGSRAEVVVCPPFCYLPLAKSKVFKIGAQDCFWKEKGAFTGQVSPLMLKNLGVRYVIVGHSEKRALGETDETVNEKLKAVLKAGLTPVLCIGETAEQRRKKETFKTVERQLKKALEKLTRAKLSKLVIAYEPVWAISPNPACSVDEAETMILFTRKTLNKIAGRKYSKTVKVIYGGNANGENAGDFLSSPWIDGLLVGAASLRIKEFLGMTKKSV